MVALMVICGGKRPFYVGAACGDGGDGQFFDVLWRSKIGEKVGLVSHCVNGSQ